MIGESTGTTNPAVRIVDGECDSACTMVLDTEDYCITDKAVFGIHSAYDPKTGKPNKGGDQVPGLSLSGGTLPGTCIRRGPSRPRIGGQIDIRREGRGSQPRRGTLLYFVRYEERQMS